MDGIRTQQGISLFRSIRPILSEVERRVVGFLEREWERGTMVVTTGEVARFLNGIGRPESVRTTRERLIEFGLIEDVDVEEHSNLVEGGTRRTLLEGWRILPRLCDIARGAPDSIDYADSDRFPIVCEPMVESASKDDEVRSSGKGVVLSAESAVPAVEPKGDPTPFTGGLMEFFPDRVKLCGVDICRGRRLKDARELLDLLRLKDDNNRFQSYSGEELANRIDRQGRQNGISGMIRDQRDRITKNLLDGANIQCGRFEVILSRDSGYRLSDTIAVKVHRSADQGPTEETASEGILETRDGTGGTGCDGTGGTGSDVPSGAGGVPSSDGGCGPSETRQAWVLKELDSGRKLVTDDVVRQFDCGGRTAKRDLEALRKSGRIEFVGTNRRGHYRLRPPPSGIAASGRDPQDLRGDDDFGTR